MMESILKAEHVSIVYKIGDFRDIGLKEWTMRRLTGKYHVEVFQAVRDVSFELNKGEMLGIIGSNGAGKSTLLKAVSGIMTPTQGSIRCGGSVAALLELGSGFDGDLTVKENAYLRGAMLGYTRQFMDETFEQIIDFAGLRGFEERPFKQLSSGMQARLAFSIASLVDPDVLILDEVLSVGDGAFQEKSTAKMREIISRGAATILVSHSIWMVRELCTKVLWLDHGREVAFGTNVKEICDAYERFLSTGEIIFQTEEDRPENRKEEEMERKTDGLAGKKLLILAGADLHCELVNTARKLGVETYVTDYLPMEQAPAKRVADHAWDLNITDVDAIVERCLEEKIDGVMNMYYNPCQLPYQAICERLGLPCFGTKEQYEIFTDKKRFLETCVKYGMDIIPQYREEDLSFDNPAVEYPLYIKPADSRGSRGQSVCRSYAEVADAIALARSESMNGGVVIQRYMENMLDYQMTFLMIDGEPYLENVGDFFNGSVEDRLSGSFIVSISPSILEDRIPPTVFEKIGGFLKALKLQNTPVFLQGFLDGDKFRVYDPALRFPACFFERGMKDFAKVDVYEAMIRFALTGRFPAYLTEVQKNHRLGGISGIAVCVYVRPGVISEVRGLDKIINGKKLMYHILYHKVGDRIENWHDIRQCFAMIVPVVRGIDAAEEAIRDIFQELQILDENGEDMKIAVFDTARLRD